MVCWAAIDTVLLDMDGTLIDLHYDNHLWNVVVPERYGRRAGMDAARATEVLYRDMLAAKATLDFYDLDYWARETGLDIDAIHEELRHLIRYRPGAAKFVAAVRGSGREAVLATNAHPRSIAVKHRATGLLGTLDGCISSHEFGSPKEDAAFWERLAERLGDGYDPARTLLVDDNVLVLEAAERAGIGQLLGIAAPDSHGATAKASAATGGAGCTGGRDGGAGGEPDAKRQLGAGPAHARGASRTDVPFPVCWDFADVMPP